MGCLSVCGLQQISRSTRSPGRGSRAEPSNVCSRPTGSTKTARHRLANRPESSHRDTCSPKPASWSSGLSLWRSTVAGSPWVSQPSTGDTKGPACLLVSDDLRQPQHLQTFAESLEHRPNVPSVRINHEHHSRTSSTDKQSPTHLDNVGKADVVDFPDHEDLVLPPWSDPPKLLAIERRSLGAFKQPCRGDHRGGTHPDQDGIPPGEPGRALEHERPDAPSQHRDKCGVRGMAQPRGVDVWIKPHKATYPRRHETRGKSGQPTRSSKAWRLSATADTPACRAGSVVVTDQLGHAWLVHEWHPRRRPVRRPARTRPRVRGLPLRPRDGLTQMFRSSACQRCRTFIRAT